MGAGELFGARAQSGGFDVATSGVSVGAIGPFCGGGVLACVGGTVTSQGGAARQYRIGFAVSGSASESIENWNAASRIISRWSGQIAAQQGLDFWQMNFSSGVPVLLPVMVPVPVGAWYLLCAVEPAEGGVASCYFWGVSLDGGDRPG